jgi:hypothetical protein
MLIEICCGWVGQVQWSHSRLIPTPRASSKSRDIHILYLTHDHIAALKPFVQHVLIWPKTLALQSEPSHQPTQPGSICRIFTLQLTSFVHCLALQVSATFIDTYQDWSDKAPRLRESVC